MIKIEDMLEVMEVGDKEKECGRSMEGSVLHGFYIRAKKDTLLEKVENTARGKFQLEKDPENYAQEARRILFEKIKDYEENKRECDDGNVEGYLFKACQNELITLAQRTKGAVTQFDKNSGEYLIVNLLSFDATDNDNNYVHEREITDMIALRKEKSYSEFLDWFKENRDKILTKKQLEYLKDENTILPNNRARMNKTISERVYRNYSEDTLIKNRIIKINEKIGVIDSIINTKTDRQMMLYLSRKIIKEGWLLESVYSLSFETCKAITRMCKGEVIICDPSCCKEIVDKLHELKQYLLSVKTELEKKI